jgi:hypothetical protein
MKIQLSKRTWIGTIQFPLNKPMPLNLITNEVVSKTRYILYINVGCHAITETEFQKFADNYSKNDFERIRFDWNGM